MQGWTILFTLLGSAGTGANMASVHPIPSMNAAAVFFFALSLFSLLVQAARERAR